MLILLKAILASLHAVAQCNPLTLAGKETYTAFCIGSKSEAANDPEIAAGASMRLLGDGEAGWKGVTLLVFSRHAVPIAAHQPGQRTAGADGGRTAVRGGQAGRRHNPHA